MKVVRFLAVAVAGLLMVAGCAVSRPVEIEDGVRSRVFTPCTQDNLCFRNTYGVARDLYCGDYPVTYRSNDYEFESKRYEWIHQSHEVVQYPTVVHR